MLRPTPTSTLFPYTTLFRSRDVALIPGDPHPEHLFALPHAAAHDRGIGDRRGVGARFGERGDRKSTRLNSSHVAISYAVFCLKKKKRRLAHLLAWRTSPGKP